MRGRSFWITLLALSLLISLLALLQAIPELQAREISLWRSKWTLLLALFALNVIAAGPIIWGVACRRFDGLSDRLKSALHTGLGPIAAILGLILPLAVFWLARLDWFADILPQLFPALWLFLWTSVLASAAFKLLTRTSWITSFAAVVLAQAALFRIWGSLLDVTDFPFTLEYSETSRFYYGSLWFSQSLYNMDLPLSILHPSRYILQAIPFLIPGLPLWVHRLWQSLLWIILTGAASYLLAHRLKFSHRGLAALVTLWGFSFFLQGAVYYHLQVCVILILLGVSHKHPWRSLGAVIAASLWAGLSRVNWFPVPAMLAIALYLLEQPVSAYRSLWHYLVRPALWTAAGLVAALSSQALYILWSGNGANAGDFSSAFTSDLIWSRLLPNSTYPPGILAGILLACGPLLIELLFFLRGKSANWGFIRPLGLFSMLGVLFLGGLIVSTKIGGGADIHNLDAFLVLLAFIGMGFLAGRVAPEQVGAEWGSLPVWPLVLAVFIPAAFALQAVGPRFAYDNLLTNKDLETLRAVVTEASSQSGEVLFISERHLVTFDIVTGIKLVPNYEVITLMEMAMSGNEAYLDKFYSDLAHHRFAVIVSRKQRVVKKGDEPFAEENNVWIEAISRPLLCYYERSLTLESSNTLLLVPSQTPGDCP
jgi:hypothetical protein